MVCLGNICRSPTAEGVFRSLVQKRGLASFIEVDSAGTSDWHIGEAPDPRTVRSAARRGYDLGAMRGRQVSHHDFPAFDYILAMDSENLRSLMKICPPGYEHRLSLLLSHGPDGRDDVPDPYYSGDEGFELVIDLIESSGSAFLDLLQKKHRFI